MFDLISNIREFLSSNAWIGTEAIITVILFIGFFYQVYQSNYNQKTIELRNEMIAIFNIILYDNNGLCWNFNRKTIILFLDVFRKIHQHNNLSLIREFCLNRVSEAIDEDCRRFLEGRELNFLIDQETKENYINIIRNHSVYENLIDNFSNIYD